MDEIDTSDSVAPDGSTPAMQAGDTYFLGRYRVVDEIGIGGMAIDPEARILYFTNLLDKRIYALDITVPAGRVWVMGDHRSNSEDSRFHDPDRTGSQGSIPISDITGRALVTVWPFDRLGVLSRFAPTFAKVPSSPVPASTVPASPVPASPVPGTPAPSSPPPATEPSRQP